MIDIKVGNRYSYIFAQNSTEFEMTLNREHVITITHVWNNVVFYTIEGHPDFESHFEMNSYMASHLKPYDARQAEEPDSEDLEEESNKVASELFDEFFPQDGDLITPSDFRNGIKKVARHFANWQNEQMAEALRTEYEKGRYDMREEMMKEAVDGEVVSIGPNINGRVYDKTQKWLYSSYSANNVPYCEIGDKVKLIIIKEG